MVQYYGDKESRLRPTDKMAITSGSLSWPLETKLTAKGLEGRIRAIALKPLLTSDSQLSLDAPNGMDEPWYVGRALPMLSVIRVCARVR